MSIDKQKKKFIRQDDSGNYDIDGVSYDGEDVVVGSGKVRSNSSFNSDQVEKNMKKKPTKVDRKKNIDSEEGATQQTSGESE